MKNNNELKQQPSVTLSNNKPPTNTNKQSYNFELDEEDFGMDDYGDEALESHKQKSFKSTQKTGGSLLPEISQSK